MEIEQKSLFNQMRKKLAGESLKMAKWKTVKFNAIVQIKFMVTKHYICFPIKKKLPGQYVFFYLLKVLQCIVHREKRQFTKV